MSGVNRFIQKFNTIADETDAKLKKNPYSDTYEEQKYNTEAIDYGRPTSGSLTEKRGVRAGEYVLREVVHLCETIVKHGEGPDESKYIKFGPLFKIYQFYSDTLVGWLIRARKYGLLEFEGEMLYQRQDDHKIIQMLMSIQFIRENVRYSGDPKNIIKINRPNAITNTESTQEGDQTPKKTVKKVKNEPLRNPAKIERAQQARAKFQGTELRQPRSAYYNFCVG